MCTSIVPFTALIARLITSGWKSVENSEGGKLLPEFAVISIKIKILSADLQKLKCSDRIVKDLNYYRTLLWEANLYIDPPTLRSGARWDGT